MKAKKLAREELRAQHEHREHPVDYGGFPLDKAHVIKQQRDAAQDDHCHHSDQVHTFKAPVLGVKNGVLDDRCDNNRRGRHLQIPDNHGHQKDGQREHVVKHFHGVRVYLKRLGASRIPYGYGIESVQAKRATGRSGGNDRGKRRAIR